MFPLPLHLALVLLATPPGPIGADTVPPAAGAPAPIGDTIPPAAEGPMPVGDSIPPAASFWRGPEASDLAIRFWGRGEFGGDWTRFRPCVTGLQLTCNPNTVPQLQPDLQFGIVAQGVVADRILVDVDYDQTREFLGANRFRIEYQGGEGETLRSVEVGDVSFDLPDSRFLTRGIPAGNFGVLARAGTGPLELQGVFAQQQGARAVREFRLADPGPEQGFVREDTLVVDDADYVRGQFVLLVDPAEIRGSPHVDILSLSPADVPAALAPGAEPIQLYRMEREPVLRQQVEGYIQAHAVADGPGLPVSETGWYRHLQPGTDYYLHPSGLWVALRSPLRPDEALAVTYITQDGDTIGDYNPERLHNVGERPQLQLLRATRGNHQPGRATWDRELKNVYRMSGTGEVEIGSVELEVSLGERSGGTTFRRGPDGRSISFLRLLGLDEELPFEQVDRSAIFLPAEEAFDEPSPVTGSFIVFRTLRPFLEPPPVPSENLTASETRAFLEPDVNRRIYEEPDPFERENAGLFRLNMSFQVRGAGLLSTFQLGAFGIREGSERVYLGEELLQPELDYVIDYRMGQVTLLAPSSLLTRVPGERLRVTWEERSMFQVAPTSVFGLNTQYSLGERGAINLLGLYQTERQMVNRPQLGVEPAALFMGGVSGQLDLATGWLDRVVTGIPGVRSEEPSSLRLSAEVAVSAPTPNTQGDVFLDDFDRADDRRVSLLTDAWHLGSAPAFREGAEDVLPAVTDEETVASLVWQHTWVEERVPGDSIGVFEGFLPREEIDRQISVAGGPTREMGLNLAFGRDQRGVFDEPRWRSITTLLSPSGIDLSQAEFLEFYVAEGDSLDLVIDLGLVSEDAFFVDEEGRTGGIHPETGRPWGLGVLDQEADPLAGEIWSEEADRRGVWPQACEAEPGRVYRLGDPRANCTRGNARRDTEDLNGNGVLDTTERYMRYVVRLDGSSPFLQRTRGETGTRFQLYRIPLQGGAGANPGGFSEADWRAIQFMRMTVAGGRPADLTFARMRIVGSRWVKRGGDGVLQGIAGDVHGSGGVVEVSPVSMLTEGAAYQAPPGVLEELDDPTQAVAGRGVEFNEQSLGIRYRDVAGGERVEVYHRFLQRPRNFMSYREARLWVVARDGDWGPGGSSSFFVKIGTDPDNFYIHRAELTRAANPGGVVPEDWLPETVIQFEEWFRLRARAEQELLASPRSPGDPPVEVWSADSTYAVVLRDRARAPNLAAVREISFGVWNEGAGLQSGEVWINELRLGGGLRAPGSANRMNLEMNAGGLLTSRVSVTGQGAYFRQLDEMATFQSSRDVSLHSTLNLDRFTPEEWGLEMPLLVSHSSHGEDPTFLRDTDLRVRNLVGLRSNRSRHTRVALSLRKETPADHGLVDLLIGGMDLRLGYTTGRSTTVTAETAADGMDVRLGYEKRPENREVPLLPAFLGPVADLLIPRPISRRLQRAQLRWSPTELAAGTGYFRQVNRIQRFDDIVWLPSDAPGLGAAGARAPREWMESSFRVRFQPFRALGGGLTFLSTRDLLDPEEGVRDARIRPLVAAERLQLAGRNLGWETHRTLRGEVAFRPELTTWLRTEVNATTRYLSDRNSGFASVQEAPGDTVAQLHRNVSGQRDLRASSSFDPARFWQSLHERFGDPDTAAEMGDDPLPRVLAPVTVTYQDGLTSRFLREPVDPGRAFQLGWGGLDDFRTLDGLGASSLVRRRSWNAGTGLRLPASAYVNANYSRSRVAAFDPRSDRSSRNQVWPDLRGGFSELPLPERLRAVVTRAGVSTGYQRDVRTSRFGAVGLQHRRTEDHRIPLEATILWPGDVHLRYRGFLVRGDGQDPTGTTDRNQRDHTLSLASVVASPALLSPRLERPPHLSLLLRYASLEECRTTVGTEVCVPFLSQLTRSASLNLDTVVSGLEIGFQATLLDRRTYVGLRSGSTQFQLGFWGRFLFTAGSSEALRELPPLLPGG